MSEPCYYAVCGTQRVGSTLLCESLATSGRAGAPREPFFAESERACAPGLGLPPDVPDYEDYVRATISADSTAGVFGFKIMWNHHRRFLDRLGELIDDADPSARLASAFPGIRAVHLTRRNKVRVAISQWRAESTGQWSLAPGRRSAAPDRLDVERVGQLHALAHEADEGWPGLLRRAGVPFQTLVYEDWMHDPVATARSVAEFLRVPGDGIGHPAMKRQRDARSGAWERQWQEAVGCPSCAR